MRSILLVVRWIFAFLGWCLFFFWWKKASTPGWVSPRAVAYSLISISSIVAAAVIYSTVWILHNKRIARKGKRGFVSFYKPPRFESDALGRRLTLLPVQHDLYDPVIVVKQSGKHKEYVVESASKGLGAKA